ncbi:MAG: hypothetical protein ACOXZ6_07920 [Syntrophomonadaceae bacterium]
MLLLRCSFIGNLNSNIAVNYAIDDADPAAPVPGAFDPTTDSPAGGEAVITSKDVYDALGNISTLFISAFLKELQHLQTMEIMWLKMGN